MVDQVAEFFSFILKQVRSRWRNVSAKAFSVLFVAGLSISLIASGWNISNPLQLAANDGRAVAAAKKEFVLRIGHQRFDPLTLVKNRGNLEARLKPLGVTSIEWKEFPSGPPLLEAFNAGSLDIARTGDTPPVVAQASGVPLFYIGTSGPKDQSSAVLVKRESPIKTIADLKGKKVAYTKGSSANYLIVKILESGKLALSDIESVFLAPADARAAFEQGSIDAWVIWDPFYAATQVQAGARVIRNSSGLVNNRDFYLSKKEFADEHADVIKQIRLETQSVAGWASKNPDQVAELLSPLLKIDKKILEVVTKRRSYGFEQFTPKVIAEQQAIADTFYNLKLIPKAIKVADAVYPPAKL